MSPRIVALGGGHGLYATLSAARRLTPHVTAVVTVADDGGSSGRLRSELDVLDPHDDPEPGVVLAAGRKRALHNKLVRGPVKNADGGIGADIHGPGIFWIVCGHY